MFLFNNIFLKTLRDNRAGAIGWGIGLGLIMLIGVTQYDQLIGGAGAARAKSIEELTKAFQAFSFMLGEVTSLGTLGGFITTRFLGFGSMILALWVLVVGVGLIRGEEQQGSMEVLLSTPQSRSSVLTQKVLALLVAALVATALFGLGLWLGVIIISDSLPFDAQLLAMVNLLALLVFWGAVGLLVGQFTISRRKASGIAGGLLVAAYLLDNLFTGTPSLSGLAWLMPFHYYSVSKPLVPGRSMDWGAWLVLVALTLVLVALTALIFSRRDVGSAVSLFRSRAAEDPEKTGSAFLLGSVFGKALRDLIGPTIGWGVALGLYGVLIIATTNETIGAMRQLAQNAGWLAKLMGDLTTNEAYVSTGLIYLPVLLAIYSIIQVENWSSEEEEGLLEVLVSMPLARWKILVARYVAAAISTFVILVLAGALMLASAAMSDVTLNVERVFGGLLAVVPVALLVLALGLTIATWLSRPGYAVTAIIVIVAVMFLMDILATIFNFPDWVRNLSIFHLYGRPMVEGIQWGGMLGLVVATVLFAAASLVGLERRDIAK